MTPKEKILFEDALFVQNAVNLSAVVHSFSRALTRLRELHPGESIEFFNQHPISTMYSSKIAALTDSESAVTFSQAYVTVSDVVNSNSEQDLVHFSEDANMTKCHLDADEVQHVGTMSPDSAMNVVTCPDCKD